MSFCGNQDNNFTLSLTVTLDVSVSKGEIGGQLFNDKTIDAHRILIGKLVW